MSKALQRIRPLERNETLAGRAHDELRTAIMAGRFRPGEKLTIRAVAAALEISLTPAREALFNLVAEGALESGPNGSVHVPTLDEARITEITRIRLALEGLAAREAALLMDDAAIEDARRLNDLIIKANRKQDYAAVIRHNWQFHFRIYECARMPVLVRMMESCWLKTGAYLNLIYPEFGRSEDGLRNHAAIVRAIERRDPVALETAIRRDIEFAARILAKAIRAEPELQ